MNESLDQYRKRRQGKWLRAQFGPLLTGSDEVKRMLSEPPFSCTDALNRTLVDLIYPEPGESRQPHGSRGGRPFKDISAREIVETYWELTEAYLGAGETCNPTQKNVCLAFANEGRSLTPNTLRSILTDAGISWKNMPCLEDLDDDAA